MKYTFFDIECSDGYHICSLGFVITDEKFRILKKEDIVMNPECKFILSSSKKRPKIELAYGQEYFFAQPNFPKFYNYIKSILEAKDTILIGHSISSDFHFLKYVCLRYDLKDFVLQGYDTQKMFKFFSGNDHLQSLETIIEELGIKANLRFHKSCDDAHATMLVAKSLCQKTGLTLEQLIGAYPTSVVDSKGMEVDSNKIRFSDKLALLKKKYNLTGRKKVAFDEKFKSISREKQFALLNKLYENGYDFTSKINSCDIFVIDGKKDNLEIYCDQLISSGKKIQKISFIKFEN